MAKPTYEQVSDMMLDISLGRPSALGVRFPKEFAQLRKEMEEIARSGAVIGGFASE
jgi:hypothetical protein